jgi:ElaB/YqjD/DUF883 family membrane-anchored ribosome-binding protein
MRKTGNGEHALLNKIMDDIKTVVLDGQDLLKAGADECKRKAVSSAQATDRSVRSHPYESIGIVFGLGALAGMLASGLIARGRNGRNGHKVAHATA